jgi:short-subunit dehydrogenase
MNNKLILITGGSSGIGKAAAIELHRQGARIIIQARGMKKLKATALEIDPSLNRISYYSTDLTDEEAVQSSAKLILENDGVPDVIINSAGAGEWLSFKEATVSHYKETMDSPYIATALTCKVFYDKMQERGNGHFIIINSAACYFSFPGATGYTPARWAMLGFSRSLQADLFNTDFKVSMIAFGKVESPYFENNPRSEERIPKIANWLIPTMSLKAAGQVISTSVKTKKGIIIKPFMLWLLVFFNRFLPATFRWLMRSTGYNSA